MRAVAKQQGTDRLLVVPDGAEPTDPDVEAIVVDGEKIVKRGVNPDSVLSRGYWVPHDEPFEDTADGGVVSKLSGWIGDRLGLGLKADWRRETGPNGATRWVKGDEVRYREPVGASDPTTGSINDVLSGDQFSLEANLDPDQEAAVSGGLERAAEMVDLNALADESGGMFSPDAKFLRVREDSARDTPALFDPEKGQVQVYANKFDEGKTASFADEHVVGDGGQLEAIVVHEIGHAAHSSMSGVSRDEIKEVEVPASASELSDRAATNPLEMVAEVFVAKAYGMEVPAEVEELYNDLGGPQP